MKPEELLEKQAEWLYNRGFDPEYDVPWAYYKCQNDYREEVRAFNRLQNDNPETTLVAVNRLPEAQTLKAMTFNQAIVELGKAHRTEAKE